MLKAVEVLLGEKRKAEHTTKLSVEKKINQLNKPLKNSVFCFYFRKFCCFKV